MDSLFVALRVLLSLAAVVGLLWVLQRRLTRGARSSRATKLVAVVTRQAIAQKASVVVVDVEGTRYLLGVTEHAVTVINATELAAEAPVAATETRDSAADFGAVMASTKAPARRTDFVPTALPQFDPKTGMPRRQTVLDGSILSLATWKRAATFLRQSR